MSKFLTWRKAIGLFSVFLTAFIFWTCNVSDSKHTKMNLKLADSLAIEAGKYDTIKVDILSADGKTVLLHDVYVGEFHQNQNGQITGIDLGTNVPDNFLIQVTGYKGNTKKLVYTIAVTGTSSATPVVTFIDTTTAPADTKPVTVNSISIAPKTMLLYTGGATDTVSATLAPSTVTLGIAFRSNDTTIAKVSPTGVVTAMTPGLVDILASPVGMLTLTDTCHVTVKKDIPILDAGSDRQVKLGVEVTFAINVTQDYGTIAVLKWDLNGDGVFEDSTTTATANPKFTYATAGEYQAKFYVKDGEGNVATVTRRVVVGNQPFVDITVPSGRDTLVNTQTFKLVYFVDSVKTTKDTILKEGLNPIVITSTNSQGTGKDSVLITLDTTPPGTPVFTAQAQNPTSNNRPSWKWNAISDAAKYQVKFDSDTSKGMIDVLSGTQYQSTLPLADGNYTLYVRAIDAVGNASGVSSQPLTVKTALPSTPVFVSAPAMVSSVRTPDWKWKTGDATKGNGTYEVWLNGQAQANVTTGEFKSSNLSDGNYILTVKELDALGQESATFLTFVQITIDGTKPTITASYANGSVNVLSTTAKVTVTGTIIDGSSGSGIQSATYSLSGATTTSATVISNPASFNLSNIVLGLGGVTTLTIATTDAAGNAQTYSMDFNVTVVKPVVKIVSPTPRDGYISNSSGSITVYYTVDGVDATPVQVSIAEPTDVATASSQVCVASATNDAGTGSDSRTFYRVNKNVVFFKPTGGVSGSCADWENACSIGNGLDKYSGKTMWLAAGDYDITGNPFSVVNMKIFGGLSTNATNTTVSSGTYSHIFAGLYAGDPHARITLDGPTLELNHISFSGSFGGAAIGSLTSDTLNFKDCKFSNFIAATPYYGVGFFVGNTMKFTRCLFDNTNGGGSMIFFTGARNGDYLSFTSCTFVTGYFPGGVSPYLDVESLDGDNPPVPLNAYRFYSPTGAEPNLRTKEMACGLSGQSSCP